MVMLTMDNTGGFQTFEFRFGNFKFFWIKVVGFCKNSWVSARVYVVGDGGVASSGAGGPAACL